jgi:DNA-binding CsgD family transcriptional regulator
MGPGDAALIERAEEIAAIGATVSSALSGTGQVLLLEAAPGLGKTSLLRAASDAGERAGMLVLNASGAMLERDLAWAVVRDVFQARIERRGPDEALFHGAAGACAGLFTGEADAALASDAAARVLHGLYWLVTNLTAERPLMVVVDDLHWVDAASQRWLAHLAARSADLPLCLVLAVRDIDQTPVAAAITSEPHTTVRRLTGFSTDGTTALLNARVGAVEPEVSDISHRLTGGNPFLLTELVRELQGARGSDWRPDAVARLRPASVTTSVLLRLSELGPTAARVSDAVAILGQQTTLPAIAELLELDQAEVVRTADELAAVGILSGVEPPLRFLHPLILEAIQVEIGVAERAYLHRRAAALLERRGAPVPVVASHLLATDPDESESVVATLRSAASQALAQGAPEVAVACLRRALEEPPVASERIGVLRELGGAEGMLASGQGLAHLRQAFAAAEDAVLRAEIAIELSAQLLTVGAVAETAEVCRSALASLDAEARELRLELLAHLAQAAGQDLTVLHDGREAVDPAELTGATRGERMLLAVLANTGISLPSPDLPALAAMSLRANSGDTLLREISSDGPMYWAAFTTVIFGDRYDEAAELLASAEEDSRLRGSSRGSGFCSAFGAAFQYRLGRLAQAEEQASRALELFADEPMIAAYARSFLIDSLLDQGKLATARRALTGVVLEGHPPLAAFAMLRLTAARLCAFDGDPAIAAERLLAIGAELGDLSSVFWPWREAAVLALQQAGEVGRARELAAVAVSEARTVQSAWLLARCLIAQGIAEDETGPLREAVAVSSEHPLLLERARGMAELGSGLRRQGSRAEAADCLREALDLADRIQAGPLAQRAEDELRLLGARPRRRRLSGADALTPAERRVCELAAMGKSNPAIAQALFVSLRTVETHLTRSYAKLGIPGREQLADAIEPAAA